MAGAATVTIRDKHWQVSLATAPYELTTGLGGLPSIPQGTGMLFDAGFEQIITITTQSMLFPIDIALFSNDMVVIDIARDVPSGCLVTSSVQARYFLEVNAAELEDIEIGNPASVVLPSYSTPLQIQMTEIINFTASTMVIALIMAMGEVKW